MPIYDWRHIPTDTMHDIIREREDIERLPTKEETKIDDTDPKNWRREIGTTSVAFAQESLKGRMGR